MIFICPNCKQETDSSIFFEDDEPSDYTNRYVSHGKQVAEYSTGTLYDDCPHCETELKAEVEWRSEGQYNEYREFEQLQDSMLTQFDVSTNLEKNPWRNAEDESPEKYKPCLTRTLNLKGRIVEGEGWHMGNFGWFGDGSGIVVEWRYKDES